MLIFWNEGWLGLVVNLYFIMKMGYDVFGLVFRGVVIWGIMCKVWGKNIGIIFILGLINKGLYM